MNGSLSVYCILIGFGPYSGSYFLTVYGILNAFVPQSGSYSLSIHYSFNDFIPHSGHHFYLLQYPPFSFYLALPLFIVKENIVPIFINGHLLDDR